MKQVDQNGFVKEQTSSAASQEHLRIGSCGVGTNCLLASDQEIDVGSKTLSNLDSVFCRSLGKCFVAGLRRGIEFPPFLQNISIVTLPLKQLDWHKNL